MIQSEEHMIYCSICGVSQEEQISKISFYLVVCSVIFYFFFSPKIFSWSWLLLSAAAGHGCSSVSHL